MSVSTYLTHGAVKAAAMVPAEGIPQKIESITQDATKAAVVVITLVALVVFCIVAWKGKTLAAVITGGLTAMLIYWIANNITSPTVQNPIDDTFEENGAPAPGSSGIGVHLAAGLLIGTQVPTRFARKQICRLRGHRPELVDVSHLQSELGSARGDLFTVNGRPSGEHGLVAREVLSETQTTDRQVRCGRCLTHVGD